MHEFDVIVLQSATIRKTHQRGIKQLISPEAYDSDGSDNLELVLDSHPYENTVKDLLILSVPKARGYR